MSVPAIDIKPNTTGLPGIGALENIVGAVLTFGLIAAVAGAAETRRVPVGSAAIVLAGIAGCAAVLSRAGATMADIVPTFVGMVCGVAVLRLLTSDRFTDEPDATDAPDSPDRGRRLSLVTLGFLGAGAVSGVAGVVLSRILASVSGDRDAFALPPVDVGAPPVPPTVQPKGVALPSFVTGNVYACEISRAKLDHFNESAFFVIGACVIVGSC